MVIMLRWIKPLIYIFESNGGILMKKSLITIIACSLILSTPIAPLHFNASPAYASDTNNSEKNAIQLIVKELNLSVINAYFAKYVPLDQNIFTTKALYEDFNAKNEYISLLQYGKKIEKNSTGYEIAQTDIQGNYARVILKRNINIIVDGKPSNGKNTESYLFKKENGTWKIENVFINWTGSPSASYTAFESTKKLDSFTYGKLPLKSTTQIDFKKEVALYKKNHPDLKKDKKDTPAPDIKVYVNNKLVNFPNQGSIIENNTVLVPLRYLSESLKAKVIWNASDKTITVKNGKDTYIFTLGKTTYTKNQDTLTLPVYPQRTDNGTTMVPLRVIGEIFGSVDWDNKTKTVKVNTSPATTTDKGKQTQQNTKTPSQTVKITDGDIKLITNALNWVIENSVNNDLQTLDQTYFDNQSTYQKFDQALKLYAKQNEDSSVKNIQLKAEVKNTKTLADQTLVLLNYKVTGTKAKGEKTTLSPQMIGLSLEKTALGITIKEFYSYETDDVETINRFIKDVSA